MRNKLHRSGILLMVIMLASCSMQKRVHRPGWHVEWHTQKTIQPNESIATNEVSAKQDAISLADKETGFADSSSALLTHEELAVALDANKVGSCSEGRKSHKGISVDRHADHLLSPAGQIRCTVYEHFGNGDTSERVDPFALIGFFAGCLGLVLGSLGFLFFVISIVSGLIAIVRILNDPSRRGMAWAFLGIMMSCVGLLVGVIGGILFFTSLLAI